MAVEELHAAEGITCPLEEEQRDMNILEMSHPQPILPAGRVEGIGIEDHPVGGKTLGDQICRHPPAHRPARQEESIDTCLEVLGGGAMGLDQPLGAVGALRPPLGVRIVEGHDRVARQGQPVAQRDHEGMVLVGACPVGQEHARRAGAGEASRNLAVGPGDGGARGHGANVGQVP